jgi:ATPase subunit of ABC transporter with duplicated ATPase domains
MIHSPIQITDLDIIFNGKTCFESFSANITYANRIGIIGRNGSGKSSLLKTIAGLISPSFGCINKPSDVSLSYIEQVIEEHGNLSGGQRFNKALSNAISAFPNLLILDEPTNHLDISNRKSLMRFLNSYDHTLIIASHDVELIKNCCNTIWHIDNNKINIFNGNYEDYIFEISSKRVFYKKELDLLTKQKSDIHTKLMNEQKRASKSKQKGEKSIENRKWPKVVSNAKARRAEETSGSKKSKIDRRKTEILDKIENAYIPEIILPRFSITSCDISDSSCVHISCGSAGYNQDIPILNNISISVLGNDRAAIIGDNGSGKSTLIKAILKHPEIIRFGEWHSIPRKDIGYLDQHYNLLDKNKTVIDIISSISPDLSNVEIRKHLNDFLFRKNEEVNSEVKNLSGGEKARLCLAVIAAKTPKLLILDEITNNLDIETKEHVISVLSSYPGAIIMISHDQDFLNRIGITYTIDIENFKK